MFLLFYQEEVNCGGLTTFSNQMLSSDLVTVTGFLIGWS